MEIDGRPVFVSPPELVILRMLQFFRAGRSVKHVRDIQFMLKVCRELDLSLLEEKIKAHGLHETWQEARETRI